MIIVIIKFNWSNEVKIFPVAATRLVMFGMNFLDIRDHRHICMYAWSIYLYIYMADFDFPLIKSAPAPGPF